MRTLFDIGEDLQALADLLDEVGGEISEDEAGAALEKWFDELGDEANRKVDGYCLLIREFEARAEARQQEAARLSALAGADGNNATRLKARLKLFLEVQGLVKVETGRFKIGIQKNGGQAPLNVPEAWEREPASAPEQFHRRVIQLDKGAIRANLEDGADIEGCSIGERGTHLRIR